MIPLQKPALWHTPVTKDKPRSQLVFPKEGMVIQVNRSATPVYLALESLQRVSAVSIEGNLSNYPQLPAGQTEGQGDGDDFGLRLGLILQGDKEPNWWNRLLAPFWVKDFMALAPNYSAGRMRFLTVSQKLPVGTFRKHPDWRGVEEEVVLRSGVPGPFGFRYSLRMPTTLAGLCVLADGDDSGSHFQLTIKSLTLETETPAL